MNAFHANWREDLESSRDLSEMEKQHYGFVLAWFDGWRMRQNLEMGRGAAVRFWKDQVISKPRKDWQLERWAEAMRWQAHWLEISLRDGKETRSLAERMKQAVMKTGAQRGLAMRSRETYAGWIARYGEWVGSAKEAMDEERASVWLGELVEKQKFAFATQKQALCSLLFFFKDVCGREEVIFNVRLRKTGKRTPVVMSAREVLALLDRLSPQNRLLAELQYGAGLRISELVRLRVKDVDRERGQVAVRNSKKDKDRVTMLPDRVKRTLDERWPALRERYEKDREAGLPGVYLPEALARKMTRAGESWEWFWVFITRWRALPARLRVFEGAVALPQSGGADIERPGVRIDEEASR